METKTMEKMNQASTTEGKPEGVTSGVAVPPFTAAGIGSVRIPHPVDPFAPHNLGSVFPPEDQIWLAVRKMRECISLVPQEQLDEVLRLAQIGTSQTSDTPPQSSSMETDHAASGPREDVSQGAVQSASQDAAESASKDPAKDPQTGADSSGTGQEKAGSEKTSDEAILKAVELPMKKGYVSKVTKRGIEYTTKFYAEMIDRMKKGQSSTQAYEAMGFDLEILGQQRAWQAAKHAKKRQEEDRLRKVSPAQFNGSLSEENTPGFSDLTDEELLAYYQARLIYLQAVVDAQKKTVLVVGGQRLVIEGTRNPDPFQMIHDYLVLQEESGQKPFTLKEICAIFGKSPSGYQSWMDRRAAQAKKEEEDRKKYGPMFYAIIVKYHYVPGKRGFRAALFRMFGEQLSPRRVRDLMKLLNLRATNYPKHVNHPADESGVPNYNHEAEAAPNLVNQDFLIAPRVIVLTDITYLYYTKADGTLQRFYVCAYYDAYTREPLGWSTGLTQDESLIARAYKMMMDRHGDEFEGRGTPDCYAVIHSDQGSVYLSKNYQVLLRKDRFDQSCSRRANSQDNAPMESYWGRMKERISVTVELCKTFESASEMVSGYMNEYWTVVVQEALAFLTPHEYYEYCMTGVYPLKEYFGVSAEKLHSQLELMKRKREEWKAARKHARELAKKREEKKEGPIEENGVLTTSPLERVAKDMETVKDNLRQEENIVKKARHMIDYLQVKKNAADEKCEQLKVLEREVLAGNIYILEHSKPEELEKLRMIDSWNSIPELAYYKKMDGLFYAKGNSPADQFCKGLMDELRKQKLLRRRTPGRKPGQSAKSPRGRYTEKATVHPHGGEAV